MQCHAGGPSVPDPAWRFFALRKHRREEERHPKTPPPFDVSLGTALELVLTRALSSDQAVVFYLVTQAVAIKQLAARAAVGVPRGLLRVSGLDRRRPRVLCRATWFVASRSRWRCEAALRCNASRTGSRCVEHLRSSQFVFHECNRPLIVR